MIYDGNFDLEEQYLRMDHAVVKDRMTIEVQRHDAQELERRRTIWRTEVSRQQANGGPVVPNVAIRGPDGTVLSFSNVAVTAHNLRNDLFAPGAINATDVIFSLCDQGLITCMARWYDSIGSAEVKDYYIDRVNDWEASGMCGYTYTIGEHANANDFGRFGGNDVHVAMDIRLMHSPEYLELNWTELGPC